MKFSVHKALNIKLKTKITNFLYKLCSYNLQFDVVKVNDKNEPLPDWNSFEPNQIIKRARPRDKNPGSGIGEVTSWKPLAATKLCGQGLAAT